MDKSQAHLDLSLNITDIMSAFRTINSEKKTSSHIQVSCKTPAFIAYCLSVSIIPVSLSAPASSIELHNVS